MTEAIAMGDIGENTRLINEEEEIDTDLDVSDEKTRDINNHFRKLFGRNPSIDEIEDMERKERLNNLKIDDFVERVVRNRPKFISTEFAKRDAEIVFKSSGRRFTLDNFVQEYQMYVFKNVFENIEKTPLVNSYVEEFKKYFFDRTESEVRKNTIFQTIV